MTYNASEDDVTFEDEGIMVLGCGPYCIGSSVEFDWCAVNCVRELREQGFKAISINYNPETVSTDYDESDKLYFEELSFERVVDIYERERSAGVVVSVGGQIPQNIAMQLHKQGVNVLGTNPEMIDRAEDRNKFSDMLDSLGIDQPPWFEIQNVLDTETMQRQCEELGYPVLVRPSYVLSGAAMRVASNYEQLDSFLKAAVGSNPDHPVVVSKFILNAKEVRPD
jgi:carbamoylphosphate synthase large subunit